MTVVDCIGDGLRRGQAHGEAARDLVREALERWEERTTLRARSSIGDYTRRLVGETGLVLAGERWFPDLVMEMRGIADGAGVEPDRILAYNLMDEQWWYDLGAQAVGSEPGCTVLGVHQAEVVAPRTVLAQNMDLPSWMDGTQLVLRIRGCSGGPDELVLTAAGMVGLTGVNDAGIAVCVNTLLMLRHRRDGVPVALVTRGLLRSRSRQDAVRLLRCVPHASGQHYAVACADGFVGVECAAGGAFISCEPHDRALAHTNHPLVHPDVDAALEAVLEQQGRIENSHHRLRAVRGVLPTIDGPSRARAALADRAAPLCVAPGAADATCTFGSVVFELGDATRAEFCLGRPGEAPWQHVDWVNESAADREVEAWA